MRVVTEVVGQMDTKVFVCFYGFKGVVVECVCEGDW